MKYYSWNQFLWINKESLKILKRWRVILGDRQENYKKWALVYLSRWPASACLSFWWRPLGITKAFRHSFRGQRQISELCGSPPSGLRQRLACSWQVCASMWIPIVIERGRGRSMFPWQYLIFLERGLSIAPSSMLWQVFFFLLGMLTLGMFFFLCPPSLWTNLVSFLCSWQCLHGT